MKPFDIEAAKQGAPVQTYDGFPVRILCFDRKGPYPIVALIESPLQDRPDWLVGYSADGTACETQSFLHLCMGSQKKTGWMNIYKSGGSYYGGHVYNDIESAKSLRRSRPWHVATIYVEWEE